MKLGILFRSDLFLGRFQTLLIGRQHAGNQVEYLKPRTTISAKV